MAVREAGRGQARCLLTAGQPTWPTPIACRAHAPQSQDGRLPDWPGGPAPSSSNPSPARPPSHLNCSRSATAPDTMVAAVAAKLQFQSQRAQ